MPFQKGNTIWVGRHHFQESKQKISEANKGHIPWNKGKKCPQLSESKRGQSNPMYGKKPFNYRNKLSKKTRMKISESCRGCTPWNKGKKLSEENIERLREAKKNITEETRRKMSEAKKGYIPWSKGKKFSEEYKRKMSEAKKGLYGGENNSQWVDGRSFKPYCPKFNKSLKEKIRERDNRICQLCGEKENGKKLGVHHIHYDKENCAPDLISLCCKCHCKVNFNREYYENLFIEKLKQRGLLIC